MKDKIKQRIRHLEKVLLIVVFTLALSSGILMKLFNVELGISLNGSVVNTDVVLPQGEEKLQGIMDGSYSKLLEEEYERSFPLREFLIKTKNTADFLLNKSSNTNVVVGGHNNLFEPAYLNSWCVTTDSHNGVMNEPTMRNIVEKLAFIRDQLKLQGKEIYILITPNKAEFFEEDIPASYQQQAQFGQENVRRNADVLSELFDEYNLPYLDVAQYFKEELPDTVEPFVRGGIHYTWAAGTYALQKLFKEIEVSTDLDMPEFTIRVEESNQTVFPNKDLYDLQNTWKLFTDFVYADDAQQVAVLENVVPSDTCVFAQGGSFLGPFISINISNPELFRQEDYVQNTVQNLYGKGQTSLGAITDVDLDDIILNDLFIFEVNEAVASGMSFGFIDYLADYLSDDEMQVVEYPTVLSFPNEYDSPYTYGIYLESNKSGWCFTRKTFGYALQNPLVATMGMSINVRVLDTLIANAPDGVVMANVSINGNDLGDFPVTDGSIFVPPEVIPQSVDNVYRLDITVNSSFIPSELNPDSPDSRELSLILISIRPG